MNGGVAGEADKPVNVHAGLFIAPGVGGLPATAASWALGWNRGAGALLGQSRPHNSGHTEKKSFHRCSPDSRMSASAFLPLLWHILVPPASPVTAALGCKVEIILTQRWCTGLKGGADGQNQNWFDVA